MKGETIQNIIHTSGLPWDESVVRARGKLGFSFSMTPEERWDWFVEGKHREVYESAHRQLGLMNLPDDPGPYGSLAQYWVCCFYSDYGPPGTFLDYGAIKGPPFLQIPCPKDLVGNPWILSVERGRSLIQKRHGLRGESDLIRWFWNLEAASEVGRLALRRVHALDLPGAYAMAWVCCFLPEGAKWMADRVPSLLKRFPQLAHWSHFTCSGQTQRDGVRAYPFVIDWSEGADEKFREKATMWDLLQRGIRLEIEADAHGNNRMALRWLPELVNVADLRMAVEYAHRYYCERLQRGARLSTLQWLVKDRTSLAKAIPSQRAQSAVRRYEADDASFEQLLCEEALIPEVQEEYRELVDTHHVSPARRQSASGDIKLLRKRVYDRVRAWLVKAGFDPKVQRKPPWWKEVLPNS